MQKKTTIHQIMLRDLKFLLYWWSCLPFSVAFCWFVLPETLILLWFCVLMLEIYWWPKNLSFTRTTSRILGDMRMRVRSATCFLPAPLDLDKLLQSVLQTLYTATRVKNLIEFGVIKRNPKTLFKDNLLRKLLTVHLPPCCILPVKCKQCQPVNILLVYWC